MTRLMSSCSCCGFASWKMSLEDFIFFQEACYQLKFDLVFLLCWCFLVYFDGCCCFTQTCSSGWGRLHSR